MDTQGVQEKFLAFAAYGSKKSETQLDGRSYVKLFKDAGLLKKPLTTTDLVGWSLQQCKIAYLKFPTVCKRVGGALMMTMTPDVAAVCATGPNLCEGEIP